MNLNALKLLMKVKNLNESDVARASGLTRQAINVWLKSKTQTINVKTVNLMKLAKHFAIEPGELINPISIYNNKEYLEKEKLSFLWDRLYPTLEDFLIDVSRDRLRALARLVEVLGLYKSQKLVGKKIWKLFPDFMHLMHPIRRKECEILWNLRFTLNLN